MGVGGDALLFPFSPPAVAGRTGPGGMTAGQLALPRPPAYG